MSWSNRYIGTPWRDLGRDASGCDCWGLACLVYRQELGIDLPDYLGAYLSADERAEVAALISAGAQSPLWHPVDDCPAAFDLVVFRRGRLTSHIGIVIRPGLMLHMAGEDAAKVEDYRSGHWAPRLTGIWRYFGRVA